MSVLAALPLFTQNGDDWGGHPWWPLWLLFWAAVIGTVVWLVVRRRDRRGDPFDRAREILAERYARDELNPEEYRKRLDELRRQAS